MCVLVPEGQRAFSVDPGSLILWESAELAASATLALNAGEWFRRGLLLMFCSSRTGI